MLALFVARPSWRRRLVHLSLVSLLAASLSARSFAEDHDKHPDHRPVFTPNNLVVSRSVYDGNAANVTVGQTLPPDCTVSSKCVTATTDGSYPFVFNNDAADGSFGITSKILLDEVNPYTGWVLHTLEVPNSTQASVAGKDQLVTSFPSKSELALNLSTDHNHITFMGYVAPVDARDISNSNTPGVIDSTNPVGLDNYRAVADVDRWGTFHFTLTNSYSGNNGRAAILDSADNVLYLSGNAGNGGKKQPAGVIEGAGAQFLVPSLLNEASQTPDATPSPLGSFNITQLGLAADKIGKDTNFRGLTIFNNVVYYTKGSGGNGINTVYFVDTTGQACPNGVGLPSPSATLPTSPLSFDPSKVQTAGLVPTNMCILKGFPATTDSTNNFFPFGIWFANDHTLYVAQEGDGDNTYDATTGTYSVAAAQTVAGLQKWILDDASGQWELAYTLQAGLNLGVPCTVAGYPTGNNSVTGLPWAPATDGLRNLTGRVDDGFATIYAITSTVSGGGDQGADPNKLVVIFDRLRATTPGRQQFHTLRRAGYAEVLRGVSFTPGTRDDDDDHGWF